jgi:hypothetical protein
VLVASRTLARALLSGVLLVACGRVGGQPPVPADETGGAGAGGAGAGGAGMGGGGAGSAGVGGSPSGGVGPGDAGTSGATSSAGAGGWMSPVAPETSRRWSWRECGRIRPDASNELGHEGNPSISSLAISQDGSILLSDAFGRVIGWRVAEPFDASQPLFRIGVEGGSMVSLTPDGRFGTASGDVRVVFETTTGNKLLQQGSETIMAPTPVSCFDSEFNFSPDGRLLAGKHYTPVVDVFETETFSLLGQFETTGCAQGIAFSADSTRIVAPDGSASLEELLPKVTPESVSSYDPSWTSLTHAPDGSFVEVRCTEGPCNGRRLGISDEGHWHVRGNTLRHVPSGEERVFDSLATEAVFAPNGDIIAGDGNANLIRFCRTE